MGKNRHQYRVLLTKEQILALPVVDREPRTSFRITEKGRMYLAALQRTGGQK